MTIHCPVCRQCKSFRTLSVSKDRETRLRCTCGQEFSLIPPMDAMWVQDMSFSEEDTAEFIQEQKQSLVGHRGKDFFSAGFFVMGND